MRKLSWFMSACLLATSMTASAFDEDTVPARPGAEKEAPVKELILGDPAPAISIAEWTKGTPVEKFSPDTVYVVEFWATWCGPCRSSMPHMSQLQKEYGDKVRFIGVSDEDAETVGKFMESEAQGGKTWNEIISYTIALDKEEATNTAYMRAAGQGGIPTAFVVGRSGKVEWIGHPMGIDEPLQLIVEGKYDLAKARADFIAERERQKALQETIPKLQKALATEDYDTAIELADSLVKRFPDQPQLQGIKFQVVIRTGRRDAILAQANKMVEVFKDDGPMLNQVAWILATGAPKEATDLDLALKIAQRSSEMQEGKDASTLDTIARIYFLQENLEEAVAWQERAVKADPGVEELRETLKEYKTALERKNAPASDDRKEKE
ncbi:MAG: redoxin domain-containing protein [Planctomycetaceae bacterium]|nr:redoxin domain-containing protein [Planctomycetaceae bacterium]